MTTYFHGYPLKWDYNYTFINKSKPSRAPFSLGLLLTVTFARFPCELQLSGVYGTVKFVLFGGLYVAVSKCWTFILFELQLYA